MIIITVYRLDGREISIDNAANISCVVNVLSPSKEEVKKISCTFGIHIGDIEDALDKSEIPKIVKRKTYTFMVLSTAVKRRDYLERVSFRVFVTKDKIIIIGSIPIHFN